ncbi:MAG TPA: hypothetical protein VGL10_05165, partial [Gammaproteobacteria bacterium]
MSNAFAALLVCAVAITGCAQQQPEPYTQSYDLWLGRAVEASNGIDKDEAAVIAYAFFASGLSSCGSPLEPQLADDYWISNTRVGRSAGNPIYIDVKTGDVRCAALTMS